MTTKTATAPQPTWQRAALEKFYRLRDIAAGHRASVVAYNDRYSEVVRRRRLLNQERVEINNMMAWTRGDTKLSEIRIKEIDHELQRLDDQLASLSAPRDLAAAKLAKSGALADSCGKLLVAIGLMSREEVLL